MPSIADTDSRNVKRICKAQGCMNVFKVVLGSRGGEKQHCSNACKQKSYRTNSGATRYQKMHELENAIALVRDMRDEALKEFQRRSEELETLYHVYGVATAESWQASEQILIQMQEAGNNPNDYEGFHNV